MVRVSWGPSFATIFLYLCCPLLLRFLNWRPIILICAIEGALILVLWLMLYKKLFSASIWKARAKKRRIKKRTPLPSFVFWFLALPMWKKFRGHIDSMN